MKLSTAKLCFLALMMLFASRLHVKTLTLPTEVYPPAHTFPPHQWKSGPTPTPIKTYMNHKCTLRGPRGVFNIVADQCVP